MLIRRFFTPSGNGFGPDFLRRNQIRLPLPVGIIVISFSSSIKPKRSSFSSRRPMCLIYNPLSSLYDGLFLPTFSDFIWPGLSHQRQHALFVKYMMNLSDGHLLTSISNNY
jgi:hypothetical protein